MRKVYFDHASTSFPKADGVAEAMMGYLTGIGCNVNRGGYSDAYDAADIVYETREMLCELFDFDTCKNVIFTANITYALNMILKGFLKQGDHVLVSAMEHNAIMRPLVQLLDKGISFDRIPCTRQGELKMECIDQLVKPNTKALILTGASNVCGTRMPLSSVGAFCRENKLVFIVDSAQIAGTYPLSMKEMGIDVLAFTGHKGLMGPQGIGGFLVTDAVAEEMEPLIAGGTGSRSDLEVTPEFLPDKFEAGTMNLPGIYGLHAALTWLKQTGMDAIRLKEEALTRYFLGRLSQMEGISIIGTLEDGRRTAVVSIQCSWMDEAELAFLLDHNYGVMTRVGMHCAPNAHKTLGTFPRGTLRFSMGYSNTEEEVDYVIHAMNQIKETQAFPQL